MYTKKVMECFQNPKNYGKIKNPDAIGKVGNVVCGDTMQLYIKIGKNKSNREIIKDIKFETFGCVAALATSSMITELAKGKTIEQALKINKDKVVKSLGNLPPVKTHCSVLAVDALAEAIYDYFVKNKKDIPADLQKRHQRIEKEKNIVEEQHKNWV